MVYEVGRLSLVTLFGYFFMYLVGHILIGYMAGIMTKKYEEEHTPEREKIANIWQFFYKWFPAIYVVFLMVMFYLG